MIRKPPESDPATISEPSPHLESYLVNWTKIAPLKDTTEVKEGRGTCIVLVGPAGVGKSTLAATVIHSEIAVPCLFLDIESGSHVLPDFPIIPSLGVPALKVMEITKFIQVEQVVQQLIVNPKPWNSVILDNGSELLKLCQDKHNFYGLADKDRYSAWNKITDDMLDITRGLRNLARSRRFVSVMVLWDTTDKDITPSGTHTYKDVQLTPKLAEKFKGIIDVMGYVEQPPKGQKPYPPILRFDRDPDIPTKMRISPQDKALLELPELIYQPDLGDIIETTMGGVKWPIAKHQAQR